jgi:hypothetical protein
MTSGAFEGLSEKEKRDVWRARSQELWTSFVMDHGKWNVEATIGCGNCFGPGYNPVVENGMYPKAFGCICGGHVIFDGDEDSQQRLPFMISGPDLTKLAREVLTRGIS